VTLEPQGQLQFDGVSTALLTEFPTLRTSYEVLRERYGGDADEPLFVYAVLYEVLGKYLDSLLVDGDEDVELRRVMEFIERLASAAPNVRSLVATEIAYPLVGPGREELRERARLFMGPNTQEVLREQERLVAGARIGLAQRLTLAIFGPRKVRVIYRQGRPNKKH
jgi:hypothetical protein